MQKQEKSLEPLIHSCMRDSCVVKSCHKEGGEGGNALPVLAFGENALSSTFA